MKDEKLEKDLKTKKVYHFVDTDAGIDQLSKEVYKNKDLEVHYPRGFEGGQKYKTIKKISFLGFKGKLPVGMVKSPFFGYGFTKTLGPFSRFIDDNFKFKVTGVTIKQLEKEIAANEEARKEADQIRAKENEDYTAERTEAEQCIGALESAIKVLSGAGTKKAMLETLQEAQLLSVVAGVKNVLRRVLRSDQV